MSGGTPTLPYRPMSVGQILDRVFRLIGLFSVMILNMALMGAGCATALAVICNDQRFRLEGVPASHTISGVPG